MTELVSESKLCTTFEMLVERLSRLEVASTTAIAALLHADEYKEPGAILSGALHCDRPIRIIKNYTGTVDSKYSLVIVTLPDMGIGYDMFHGRREQLLGKAKHEELLERELNDDLDPTCESVGIKSGHVDLTYHLAELEAKACVPGVVAVGYDAIAFHMATASQKAPATLHDVMKVAESILRSVGAPEMSGIVDVHLVNGWHPQAVALVRRDNISRDQWEAMRSELRAALIRHEAEDLHSFFKGKLPR